MNRPAFLVFATKSIPLITLKAGFLGSSGRIGRSWAEMPFQCRQLPACRQDVRQLAPRGELRGVLPEVAAADLQLPELPLDHAKWVLDLGPHAALGVGPLGCSLVASVVGQQPVRLDQIIDAVSPAFGGVHQHQRGVRAEVPLLGLAQLWFVLGALILGRAWRRNQHGIG